ncbi:MAG: glucose dehydrogenase [Thermoleophilia bacterium]|nr:glucose dehydrogenase [Thermoleophilia bacterium]
MEPVKLTVKASEFRFAVSKSRVAVGSTVFAVRNGDSVVHDFVVAGRRTRILQPGEQQSLKVIFKKPGRYVYFCSVPGHRNAGMKGLLTVGKKLAVLPPVPVAPKISGDTARLTLVGSGFGRPVLLASPPGDTRRQMVVEQSGRIQTMLDGKLLAAPFLDIRDLVTNLNEPGLLGLAFAPDWASSGRAYVVYNDRVGNYNLNLVEYRRNPVNPETLDPGSARLVLAIEKPYENHNGGMIAFGPDGYLYWSVGDGDSGVHHVPGAFAQTLDDRLGSILRIDPLHPVPYGAPYSVPADNPFVGVAGALPEIWAYGLRNPWRFWIDPRIGDMFIGDVGYSDREEVDRIPAGKGGLNFGWPCFEGTLSRNTGSCLEPVAPLFEYQHAAGNCSIIAGPVMRDPRFPTLQGLLAWADFCTGVINLSDVSAAPVAHSSLQLNVPEVTSFGLDAQGRIYVMSLRGDVYRLDPQ